MIAITGGCGRSSVRKANFAADPRLEQAANFRALYGANCSACHGEEGRGSVAVALASPVYLQISDNDVIRNVIANGGPSELSPAFSVPMGGLLSAQDIAVLVDGIRSWSESQALAGATAPRRSENVPGNVQRGAEVFRTFCSSCHGESGTGGKTPGSIVDPSLLALLTDQDLRTLVIVGLPQFGAPDWRNDLPGHPMTDQQISDVVAWLASQRVQYPGQPYLQQSRATGGKQ